MFKGRNTKILGLRFFGGIATIECLWLAIRQPGLHYGFDHAAKGFDHAAKGIDHATKGFDHATTGFDHAAKGNTIGEHAQSVNDDSTF